MSQEEARPVTEPPRQFTVTIQYSQFVYLLDSLKEAVRNLEKILAESKAGGSR